MARLKANAASVRASARAPRPTSTEPIVSEPAKAEEAPAEPKPAREKKERQKRKRTHENAENGAAQESPNADGTNKAEEPMVAEEPKPERQERHERNERNEQRPRRDDLLSQFDACVKAEGVLEVMPEGFGFLR